MFSVYSWHVRDLCVEFALGVNFPNHMLGAKIVYLFVVEVLLRIEHGGLWSWLTYLSCFLSRRWVFKKSLAG